MGKKPIREWHLGSIVYIYFIFLICKQSKISGNHVSSKIAKFEHVDATSTKTMVVYDMGCVLQGFESSRVSNVWFNSSKLISELSQEFKSLEVSS